MSAATRLDAAAILREHGIRPRHRLGQNFLDDPAALQRIVEAAGVQETDAVLEIGCGLGSLTRYLAQASHSVVAVELDARLAAIAQQSMASYKNVKIVRADFLEIAPGDLGLPSGYVVAANIPYYITASILRHILESEPRPSRIVLTVQKEVARRVCATPPDMSLLAVSIQVFGSAQVVAQLPAESFYPRPKVDSAVVRVDCHDRPIVRASLLPVFFRLVRAGFRQSRKMLRNSLAAGLRLSASDTQSLLVQGGIDPRRRAETLAIEEWAKLSELMSSRMG